MTSYGTAGGGLKNPTWLDNKQTAAAGLRGEEQTAELLTRILAPGAVVLHDLTIPGSKANIDHVVVSGTTVTLIDAKNWKPGTYWTLRGITRRGFAFLPQHAAGVPTAQRTHIGESFPPADKRTMPFAHKRITDLFTQRGVRAKLPVPIIAVWSSRRGQPVKLHARVDGQRFLNAEQLTSRLLGSKPADPRVVAVLKTLLPR